MANPGHKLNRDIYVNDCEVLPLFRDHNPEERDRPALAGFDPARPEQSYVENTAETHRRKYGQVFTPGRVAEFMSEWVVGARPRTCLDPACGTGVFVREVLARAPGCHVTAIDADPLILHAAKKTLSATTSVHLVNRDFLTWDSRQTFDAIIANPPYLKHHNFHYARDIFSDVGERAGLKISGLANIYVLFILEICRRLAPRGRAAIIVPGEWVNANFGKSLKEFLLSRSLLKALVYFSHSSCVFADALTTASILLIEQTGPARPAETVLSTYVDSDVSLNTLRPLLKLEPVQAPGVVCRKVPTAQLLAEKKWDALLRTEERQESPGYVRLSEIAETRRGIATGANSFFHVAEPTLKTYEISAHVAVPCVGKSRDVRGLVFRASDYAALRESDARCYLLDFHEPLTARDREYLRRGEVEGLPTRYLLSKRAPWYSMERRAPAPIWAGVFSRNEVRFVFNEAGVRCLTAFHGIYPRSGGELLARALAAVLNSRKAHEYVTRERRVYGGGLAKFEPADLLDIRVPDLRFVRPETLSQLATLLDSLDDSYRTENQAGATAFDELDVLVETAASEAAHSRQEN
jgi:adenine-specific DNA-methyltransferase